MMSSWTNFIGELGTASLVLQIILVNIVLSGDNAVVIALACRGLPPKQRRMGMFLGAGVAVVLRIVFTLIVVQLLAIPLLRVVGGLLLFWIAVKLIIEDESEGESKIAASDRLWNAVKTVAIADAVMSLDNVLAIAGIAQGSTFLLILGLAISIPLIVVGASLLTVVLDRFPILVWAGAALLGWVAGEMIVSDPFVLKVFAGESTWVVADPSGSAGLKPGAALHYVASTLGALFVVGAAMFIRRRREATI